MTPEDEMRRANDFKRLTKDSAYIEAFTILRDRLYILNEQDNPDDKTARINADIKALARVRKYMEQVILGGKMAADQIERDRTFRERVGDRIRSIA
jgi:hypothetical protein